MKSVKVLLPGLVAIFFFIPLAYAIDPRELLLKSKNSFTEEEARRGSAFTVDAATAQEAAGQSTVDQKNFLMNVASEPLIAAPASTTMEATSGVPKQVGWSGGSTYPFIYLDSKIRGRGYLLTDSAGFYRSDDGGANWYASNQGIANLTIASLAIAPTNSNILYAGSVAGIHRSTDGGKTWVYLSNTKNITFKRLANYRAIAVDAFDSNKVYAGSASGQVFQSLNAGGTWTQLGNLGIGVPVSVLHRTRDGRLFVGSSKGLMMYRSGAWQKMPLQSNNVFDAASVMENGREVIYVTNGLRIAYTSDLGVPVTWRYTNAMPRFDSSSEGLANRLTVRKDSAGRTQIFVGQKRSWQGRAYYSPDNGVTWRNVSQNFINDPNVNPTRVWEKGLDVPISVAFDPFNPNVFLITDDWGIWKSTDSGSSWRESIRGTPNTVGTALVRDARTGTYLIGTMDNGLVEFNPSTGALKAAFPNASTAGIYQGHVWRVLALPNGNRVLTASPWNDSGNRVVVLRPDGSMACANGLPSLYPRVNTVWEKGYARGLAMDPKNPNRLYLAIDGDDGGGLYISNDGGFNWTKSSGQPASKRIYDGLAVDPVETQNLYWGTMWAGTSGGIFKSPDGGRTWRKVFSTSANVAEIVVARNQTVYAGAESAGSPALYVSRDKGNTWSLLKKFDGTGGPLEAITIDPLNPSRMVVSTRKWNDYTGAKIYMTRDGGATWQEILSSGLPNTSGAAKMLFSSDGKMLYVLLNAGTLYQVALA